MVFKGEVSVTARYKVSFSLLKPPSTIQRERNKLELIMHLVIIWPRWGHTSLKLL